MSEMFKYLFTPIELGTISIRNRIVSTAHATAYTKDGIPTDRLVAYHEARARGGIGLIIMGATTVHPTSPYEEYNLQSSIDDRIIPTYKKLAKATHKYGAKIMAQLSHMGRSGMTDDAVFPLYGPSPIPDEVRREPPAEMDVELIEEIIEAYGAAAVRAREGGLDGVEIHGGHSSLVAQFMSPYANQRKDKYGGSREKYLKFPLQVIQAIRKRVGRDFTVGIRISGDEYVDNGLTLEDVKKNAMDLEATGLLDFIDVTAGTDSNMHSLVMHYSPMYVPLGNLTYLAAGIKEVVQLPIITVGRINDPVLAEKVLADGLADLVGMTRAALCDPDFPNKAQEDRIDDIRHCMACNQGCFKRIYKAEPITCIQNPSAGKERELGEIIKAPVSRKVVIVGGGPAGMETARVAAERGHQVFLFEKGPELGGQVNIAARAPGREEFGESSRFLAGQVEKLDIEIRLGVEAKVEDILGLDPGSVVIATGARPLIPEMEGIEEESVVTAWDVLKGRMPDGKNFIVVDGDNENHVAIGAAECLADSEKRVEIITELTHLCSDQHITTLTAIHQRFFEKKIKITPHTGLRRIEKERVVLFNVYTGEEEIREEIDGVVLALGREAEDQLYWALKGKVENLYRIGDCLAPRSLLSAISEGTRTGRIL